MEWRVIARSRGLRRDRQSSIAAAALTRATDRRIIVGRGDVAQLGERRVRNAKVEGSIPFVSTSHLRPTLLRRPCRLRNSANAWGAVRAPADRPNIYLPS